MADRIYLNVISDFDTTGFMRPRAITWKDGRTFRIEEIKDYRPASAFRKGMQRDCYRKGAKPAGKTLNAVIVARQIYNGTFQRTAEPAVQ